MTRTKTPRTEPTPTIGRRRFLRNAGLLGAGVTLSTFPLGFASAAAAQTGPRSLVCVFLAGGADSFNMFIPRDHRVAGQDHATYAATRGTFAVPYNQLLPVGDGDFGLHPALPQLADIAGSDRLAVVTNVGPLTRPTTRDDYVAERSLPQSLFAHDAQQKLWQSARSDLTEDFGWGGTIAAAVSTSADLISPSFSIAGSNIWQNSAVAPASRLSSTVRIERLLGYDASLRSWIPSFAGVEDVLDQSLRLADDSTSILERAAAETIRQSIVTTAELQEATAATPANDVGMDDVGGNRLGQQLLQVARLIKNRDALGMDRQVFFVRMGGWDTHRAQSQLLPILLDQLDRAIGSFQRALDGLGVAESVTTFTASDFARTLTINGDGTDHGWGGHAFVIGGAVKGGRYGTFPSYAVENNPDDVATTNSRGFAGRLIPTTSVSQHGSTLARWMGLDDQQIRIAFPEVTNFASDDLGFMTR